MKSEEEFLSELSTSELLDEVSDLQNALKAKVAQVDLLLARVSELEGLLRKSTQALDDWTSTVAPELCDDARVTEAGKRIMDGGGTLYYIACIVTANHKALKG